MKPVLVNPHHVKKSKELDDNNLTKNNRKDPKVIAGLIKDGRYLYLYLPDGVVCGSVDGIKSSVPDAVGTYENTESNQSVALRLLP